MLRVFTLIFLLAVVDCLVCSNKGYEEYLQEYSFKESLSADYVKFDVLRIVLVLAIIKRVICPTVTN